MFIKYTECLDVNIIHIPDNSIWSIYYSETDFEGKDDGSIYLKIDQKEPILIRYAEYMLSGHPQLTFFEVGNLYSDIVNSIGEMIKENPSLHYIDINQIEETLISDKYFERWSKGGYIEVDEKGCW